jgi:hypothetical protein
MSEPNERYKNVLQTIKDIENGPPSRSPLWFKKHYEILQDFKINLGCYIDLHPEIQDETFRKHLITLEDCSRDLMFSYSVANAFCLYKYLAFNKSVVWIVEYLTAEDEISHMLETFKIC